MNKPAESTRFRVEAAREAAILRGDIRDDLIRDEVLADLFAATARARPDHPALVFGETRHSYGEVDARSDAIAARADRSAASARATSSACGCRAAPTC